MGSNDFLTGAIMVLTAVAVWFHLKKFTYWSSRNIKGPMPWPILGTNIYYLFENKLKVDARWNKQYGKVYGLYEGYSPLLRVNDSELINFIYVKQFSSFTGRHSEFIYHEVQRNWLLWATGKQWSARRSLVSPMFSSSKMKLMMPNMSDCVNRFLGEVGRRSLDQDTARIADDKLSNGTATNQESNDKQEGIQMTKADISAMTLDVIATNFYSLKLDTHRDKSNEFLKRAYDFSTLDVARFLAWLLTPRQIARAISLDLFPYSKMEYFDLLAQKIIGERRKSKTGTAQKKVDLVQAFLDAKLMDTSDHEADTRAENESLSNVQISQEQNRDIQALNTKPLVSLSDIDIRGQMTFLFIAGFETTAQTLNFGLFELAQQPETQERIYEELVKVFESNLTTISSMTESFPSESYNDLMDLTLLGAFISETLRLYAPIIEYTRRVVEPVVLPSQPELSLPVGMPISTNSFIVQHDPDYWDEPEKFDLTRFLPENRDKIRPGTYLPFGLGNRICLGMRFALLEIKLALVRIILNYRILPVSKEYPPKFQQNVVFLLLENNDFKLVPRKR